MKKKEKILKILLLLIGVISIIQIVIRFIKGISSFGWLIPLQSICIEIGLVPWGMICLLLGLALPFKKTDKNNGKSLLIAGIVFLLVTFGAISTMINFFGSFGALIENAWIVMPLFMISLFAFALYIIKTNKDRKKAKILLLIVGLLSLIYETIFLLIMGVKTLPSLIILLIGVLFGIVCCFTAKKISVLNKKRK